MAKLKELIQKARNNENNNEDIWNTKVRLKSKIVVEKSLKNVSYKNWKKVRHITPNWVMFWGKSLINQIAESGKLIKEDNEKFASKEILEKFKKYVGNDSLKTNRGKIKISEINEGDEIKDTWENIATIFEEGGKIYGRDSDRYSFQSEDAFLFLQEIIDNNKFFSTIEYKRDGIFKLGEWKNDNENELDVEAEELINVRKLLSKDFSEDEIRKMEELDVSDENLMGGLDLSEFPNLKKLDCSDNKLTSLDLSENVNLIYLDCSYNQLKGKLDLTSNEKLTSLDCSFNKLDELVISNCPDLEMLVCSDNKLKKFLLNNLNPNKLTYLNISDNNLQGDLVDFEKFSNLELLWIGSEDESKIKKEGICNRFRGSLESLKDMDKLESLHISNTDIDGYSDRLPSNMEIYYSTEERPNSKLNEIKEKLREKYKNSSSQLIKLKEELEILERKIEEMEIQALIEVPSDCN